MAYQPYTLRVIARAIITKTDMGQGTSAELVQVYPEAERAAILAEVYRMRPDLEPEQ
ncbi:hypothetical protein [Pelotomaculum propionicicum]|uniref:Uncharacterized protein n=1 Tax=Pelotomaculum propionicicum TaxID=258475 RepID=A0A4Y7RWR9_9FIRM|nr:hypothetical protein [Pelotomaculum propionicicum]TEB13351.1 hypothetical protein Pmgp_00245 [Pelotomaculum propionicicum]